MAPPPSFILCFRQCGDCRVFAFVPVSSVLVLPASMDDAPVTTTSLLQHAVSPLNPEVDFFRVEARAPRDNLKGFTTYSRFLGPFAHWALLQLRHGNEPIHIHRL